MRYFLLILISIASILFFSFKPVFAQSDYVLPYPSSMPGSKLYKIHLIWEEVMRYWYFGSFGQFKYNLDQADKYLVEAKTLFEYKQYLFANQALKKSNNYFVISLKYLNEAKKEGKNIEQKQKMFKNAALKHKEILEKIKSEIPEEFIWQPEKEKSTTLKLWKMIDQSTKTRENYL